ncbi:MAG: hypothetical protein QXR62_05325 [Candidatus Bathyarchaeia archaeon]
MDRVWRALSCSYSPKYARQCMSLIRRYAFILDAGDASILHALKPEKRVKVMKALSVYARITGRAREWRALREAYGLKWSAEVDVWPRMLGGQEYSRLIAEARVIIGASESIRSIAEFIALSGLRASEALEAIRLFKLDRDGYLNRELMVLEHYRHLSAFLRRSKKAYITVWSSNKFISERKYGFSMLRDAAFKHTAWEADPDLCRTNTVIRLY